MRCMLQAILRKTARFSRYGPVRVSRHPMQAPSGLRYSPEGGRLQNIRRVQLLMRLLQRQASDDRPAPTSRQRKRPDELKM